MFTLSSLKPAKGAVKESRRRARGTASGRGKTAGRGEKGQRSRSGGKKPIFFEGGQRPLYRRLPKRGFKNFNRVEYEVINLSKLNNFFENGEKVSPLTLKEKGLISGSRPVKILGTGELTKQVSFEGVKFSKSAQEKLKQADGSKDA